MAVFVAVHGAMHGGWAWTPVRRLLGDEGHEMYTPTLTGQGERRHLLTPEVGVATHVEDVASLIEFEGLDDVVLVLHSYAGVLAGPLAQRCASVIRMVVLAGGFHVRPGQSLLDVEPPTVAASYRQQAAERGDGWRVPATAAFLTQWAVTDPQLQQFVGSRLVDFPLRAQTNPVVYDPAPLASMRRVYIEHTEPPLLSLAQSLQTALDDGFEHVTIATGHDLMLADPRGTARLLLGLLPA